MSRTPLRIAGRTKWDELDAAPSAATVAGSRTAKPYGVLPIAGSSIVSVFRMRQSPVFYPDMDEEAVR